MIALLYQGTPRSGASVPRGAGPTASAVAASGSETTLHSVAPQTFAELISMASNASKSQAIALDGTSRESTAAAANSRVVLGIPASDRRLTIIPPVAADPHLVTQVNDASMERRA